MAEGEKWMLEQWADFFDELYNRKLRRLDELNNEKMQELGEIYGYESSTVKEEALKRGAKYAFLQLGGGIAKGFVDVLRIGETSRKPSGGSVIRDSLRLIMIGGGVANVAKGFIRGRMIYSARLNAAYDIPGNTMSCTPTGSARALRLSGVKMDATIADVVEGVTSVEGNLITQESALWSFFEGASISRFMGNLRRLGLNIYEAEGANSIKEIEKLVAKTGKPILFDAHGTKLHLVKHGKYETMVPVEKHTMLAYKDLWGRVRFADQHRAGLASFELTRFDVINEAFQMEHAPIVAADTVPQAGLLTGGIQSGGGMPFWAKMIAVPVRVVDQKFMNEAEMNVRKRLKELSPAKSRPVISSQTSGAKPQIISTSGLTKSTTSIEVNSESRPITSTTYSYKVITGDTLFGLAKRFYGDAAKYVWIQKANANYLPSIQPSQQLPVNAEIVIP